LSYKAVLVCYEEAQQHLEAINPTATHQQDGEGISELHEQEGLPSFGMA